MMKVKGIKVDRDFGVCGCGPMPDNDYLQVVIDENGKEVFIFVSRFCEYKQARVADESLIEHYKSDNIDEANEKIDSITKEQYDWEDGMEFYEDSEYQNIQDSKYSRVIYFAAKILDEYLENCRDEIEYDDPENPFASYIGMTSDVLPQPVTPIEWDENDEYEDLNFHAYDLQVRETDPCGWIDEFLAECKVQDKQKGKTVYAYLCGGIDNFYDFFILDHSIINIENDDDRRKEEETAILSFGPYLEDAEDSEYVEVFRRLLYSVLKKKNENVSCIE